jgi:hypothetical protein
MECDKMDAYKPFKLELSKDKSIISIVESYEFIYGLKLNKEELSDLVKDLQNIVKKMR